MDSIIGSDIFNSSRFTGITPILFSFISIVFHPFSYHIVSCIRIPVLQKVSRKIFLQYHNFKSPLSFTISFHKKKSNLS